jgi:hypothetical protein
LNGHAAVLLVLERATPQRKFRFDVMKLIESMRKPRDQVPTNTLRKSSSLVYKTPKQKPLFRLEPTISTDGFEKFVLKQYSPSFLHAPVAMHKTQVT